NGEVVVDLMAIGNGECRSGIGIGGVVGQKLVIDALAAAEAFIHAMPELDMALAQTPAQINFSVVVERREIEQSDIKIFHDTTLLMNRLQGCAQLRSRLVAALPSAEQAVSIHGHAAPHCDVASSFA